MKRASYEYAYRYTPTTHNTSPWYYTHTLLHIVPHSGTVQHYTHCTTQSATLKYYTHVESQ